MIEYIKKIVIDNEKMRKNFNEVMEKNHYYWKKFQNSNQIFKWLHNFANEEEIYLALVLANNILYYTQDQIKCLWQLILLNRVKLYLLEEIFKEELPPDIKEWFPNYLEEKCMFVGYGTVGKSGSYIVYDFRHSSGISDLNLNCKELFEFLHGSLDLGSKEWIFLLDDFVGSGKQAISTWFEKINGVSFDDIHNRYPDLRFVYLTLIGCTDGREKIAQQTPIARIIFGEELDERFKCFSDTSIVYTIASERNRARTVMQNKGKILYKYPLGYGNMQLAVAFCHNTPNDSLPVIWKRMPNGSWDPLFERFES